MMAGRASVGRQPGMENCFVGLDHSYWRDRLPRDFKFYLDRLARSFVRVQPSNGPAFAMVLMEQLLAKRNDELEKLPEVSYLNILKEKLDKRACPCGQDIQQEEPADGESMVYVCRSCGRTSRQLQTLGPESENFRQPEEDVSSKATESTKKSTVVTFSREVQTRDSVWDEGIQVNFGQDQATQVSGRLPDSPHYPESVIIFSPLPGQVFSQTRPPPPPRQPQPARERLRPALNMAENVCTTCLVSAVEEHARTELKHEDGAEDPCRCGPQASYKPAPALPPATGTQWTQMSPNLKVGTCPTCGERRTDVSTPSTKSTPPPGICRACAESYDQRFKPVCRPTNSSPSAMPRVAQDDAKNRPIYLPASETYALLSPLQPDQRGFRPVSGSVLVPSPQPATRSEAPYSRQGYSSVCYDCMASEVEARAFAELKCEHPSFGTCVACEVERSTVRQSPPVISQSVPARLPSAHPTCVCGCSPQQGFQPILDPFLPANTQPMNTHHVQYSKKTKDPPPVCGLCVASAAEDRAFDELRLENPIQITCYHGGENRQAASTSPAARPTLQPSSHPYDILSPMPGQNSAQTPVSKPLVVNTTVCANCIAEPKLEKPAYGMCVCETGMKPTPPPAPKPVSRPPLANSAMCGNCMASEVESLAITELKSENPSFGKGMVRQAEPNSRSFEPVRDINTLPPVPNQGFRPVSKPVSSSPVHKKTTPQNPTPSPVLRPSPEPYQILSTMPLDRPTHSAGSGMQSKKPLVVNTTVYANCIAEPKLEKPAYGMCVCETGMKPTSPPARKPVSRPPLANSATCGNCMASEVESLAIAELKSENPSFGKGMVRQAEPNSRSFEPVRDIDTLPPVPNQGFRPVSKPVSSSPVHKKTTPQNPTPSPVLRPSPEPYQILSPMPLDRPTRSAGSGMRSRKPLVVSTTVCTNCIAEPKLEKPAYGMCVCETGMKPTPPPAPKPVSRPPLANSATCGNCMASEVESLAIAELKSENPSFGKGMVRQAEPNSRSFEPVRDIDTLPPVPNQGFRPVSKPVSSSPVHKKTTPQNPTPSPILQPSPEPYQILSPMPLDSRTCSAGSGMWSRKPLVVNTTVCANYIAEPKLEKPAYGMCVCETGMKPTSPPAPKPLSRPPLANSTTCGNCMASEVESLAIAELTSENPSFGKGMVRQAEPNSRSFEPVRDIDTLPPVPNQGFRPVSKPVSSSPVHKKTTPQNPTPSPVLRPSPEPYQILSPMPLDRPTRSAGIGMQSSSPSIESGHKCVACGYSGASSRGHVENKPMATARSASGDRDSPGKKMTHGGPPTTATPQKLPCTCDHRPPTRSWGVQSGGPMLPHTRPYTAVRDEMGSSNPMSDSLYSQSPQYQGEPMYQQVYQPVPSPGMLQLIQQQPPCCPFCCKGQSPMVPFHSPYCCMYPPDLQAFGSATPPVQFSPSVSPSPLQYQQFQPVQQQQSSPHACAFCSAKKGKEQGPPPEEYQVQVNQTPEPVMRPIISPAQTERAVDKLTEYCILGALSSHIPGPQPVRTPPPVIQQESECQCQRLVPRADSPATCTALSDLPDNLSHVSSPSPHGVMPPLNVNVNVEVDSNFDSQQFMQEVKQQITDAVEQVMDCQRQALEFQRQCLASDQQMLRQLQEATRPMICPPEEHVRETTPPREVSFTPEPQVSVLVPPRRPPPEENQPRQEPGSGLLGTQETEQKPWSLEEDTMAFMKHPRLVPVSLKTELVDDNHHSFSFCSPHIRNWQPGSTSNSVKEEVGTQNRSNAKEYPRKGLTDIVGPVSKKIAQDRGSTDSCHAVSMAQEVKWAKSDSNQLKNLKSFRNNCVAQVLKCKIQKKHRRCMKRIASYIDQDIFPNTVLSARQDWVFDWILGYCVRHQCQSLMGKSKSKGYKLKRGTSCPDCFVRDWKPQFGSGLSNEKDMKSFKNNQPNDTSINWTANPDDEHQRQKWCPVLSEMGISGFSKNPKCIAQCTNTSHHKHHFPSQPCNLHASTQAEAQQVPCIQSCDVLPVNPLNVVEERKKKERKKEERKKESQHIVSRLPSCKNRPKSSQKVKCRKLILPSHKSNIQEFPASPEFPAGISGQNHHSNIHEKVFQIKRSAELEAKPVLSQCQGDVSEDFHMEESPSISAGDWAAKQASCQQSILPNSQNQFAENVHSQNGHFGFRSRTLIPPTMRKEKYQIGDWCEYCFDQLRSKDESDYRKRVESPRQDSQKALKMITADRMCNLSSSLKQSELFFEHLCNISNTHLLNYRLAEHQTSAQCESLNNSLKWRCVPAYRNEKYTHHSDQRIKNEPPGDSCLNSVPLEECEKCCVTLQSKDVFMELPSVPFEECHLCFSAKQNGDLQKATENHFLKLAVDKKMLVKDCGVQTGTNSREDNSQRSDKVRNVENELYMVSSMMYWEPQDTVAFIQDILLEILQNTLEITDSISIMDTEDRDNDVYFQENRSHSFLRYLSESKVWDINMPGKDCCPTYIKESPEHVLERTGQSESDENDIPTVNTTLGLGHKKITCKREHNIRGKTGICVLRTVDGRSPYPNNTGYQYSKMFSPLTGHYGVSTSDVRAEAHDLAFQTRSARSSSVHESSQNLSVLETAPKMLDPRGLLMRTVSPKCLRDLVPVCGDDVFKSPIMDRGALLQLAESHVADNVILKTDIPVCQPCKMELESQSYDFSSKEPMPCDPEECVAMSSSLSEALLDFQGISTLTTDDRVQAESFISYYQSPVDFLREKTALYTNTSNVLTKLGELYVSEVYPMINSFNRTLVFYTSLFREDPAIHLSEAQCICIAMLKAFGSESKKNIIPRNIGLLSLSLDANEQEYAPLHCRYSFQNLEESCCNEGNVNYAYGHEHIHIPCIQTAFYTDAALSESNTNTSARSNSPVSFEDDKQDEKSLSNSLTVTDTEMQTNTSDISDSFRSSQTASSPGHKAQTYSGAENSSFSQWNGIQGGVSPQSSDSKNYDHAKSVEEQTVESCSSGCNSAVSYDRYGRSLKSQYTRCLQEPSAQHYHNKNNVSARERSHTGKHGAPHEMRQTLLDLPCCSLTPAGVQRVTDWLEDNDDDDDDDGDMSCISSSTITQLQISPQPSTEQLSTSGSDADPIISSSDVLCPDEEQALKQQELCELTDFVTLEMVFQEEELQQAHPNRNHNTKGYRGVKRHKKRSDLDILPTSESALWKNDYQLKQVNNVKKVEHVAKIRKLRELSELADFVALENAIQKQNHLKEHGYKFQNQEFSYEKCHNFSEQSMWPLDSIPEEDELEDQELSKRSPYSDIDQIAGGQASQSARLTQCRKDNNLGTELHQLSFDSDAERADSAVMSQDRAIQVGRHAAGLRLNGKQDRNPQLSTCNKFSTMHRMKGLHSQSTAGDHTTDGVSQNQAVTASRVGPVSDDDDGVDQPRLGLPLVNTIQRGQSCMNHDYSSLPEAPDKKTKLSSNTVDMTKSGASLLDSGFESGDTSWVSATNSAVLRECCGSLERSVSTCNESLCRSDPDPGKQMSGKRTIHNENKMFSLCEKETGSQNAKHSTLVHHGQTCTQKAARKYPESTVLSHCRPEVLPRSKQTIATVSKAVNLVPTVGSKRLCTSPDCSHKTSPVQSAESGESGPATGLWRKDTRVSRLGRLSSTIKAIAHRRWKKCYISDESVAAGYIVRKKTHYSPSVDTPKTKLKESNEKTNIKKATDDGQLSQNWSQLSDLVISKIIEMDPSKSNSSTNRPISVSVSSEMSIEGEESSRKYKNRNERKCIESDFKRANTGKLENQSKAWKDVERDSGPITPATLKVATQNNSMKETELYLETTKARDRESLVRKSDARQLQKFRKYGESSFKSIDYRKSECLLESRKSAIRKCDAATSAGTKSQPLVSRSKECAMVAQEASYFKLSQKDKPANCRSVLDEDYLQTTEKSSEVSKTSRTYSDNKPMSLSMNKPSRSEDSRCVYNASVHSLSSSDMSVDDEHFWSNCKVIGLDNNNSDWNEGQSNQNDMKDQPEVQTSNHKTVKMQKISGRNCSKQGEKSVSETDAQPMHNKHDRALMHANASVGRFYRELLAVVSDELDSDGCDSTSAESLYTQELKPQKGDPRNVKKACTKKSRKHQLNRSKIDTNNTDSQQEIANLHRHVSGSLDLQHQRKSSQPMYQPDNTCESHYYNTQYSSTVCREASTGASPSGMAMTSNWNAQKLDCKMLQKTADHDVTDDTCSSAHSALTSPCHQKAALLHVDGSENPLPGYIYQRPGLGKKKGENAERGPVGLLRKFFAKHKGDTALSKMNSRAKVRD